MNIWIASLGKSFLKSNPDQPIIILHVCSYFLMWMPTMKMLHRRKSHNHLYMIMSSNIPDYVNKFPTANHSKNNVDGISSA